MARTLLTPEERRMRHRAVYMVNNAVKLGHLTRPRRCSECLRRKPRIQGHHPDYSKPLEVEWLCVACHMWRHYPLKQPAA